MNMKILSWLLLLLKLQHTDINILAANLPSSPSCSLPGPFPDGLWSVHNPFSAALLPPPFSPGLWQDKSDKRKEGTHYDPRACIKAKRIHQVRLHWGASAVCLCEITSPWLNGILHFAGCQQLPEKANRHMSDLKESHLAVKYWGLTRF